MNAHVDLTAIRDIAETIRAMLGDAYDDQTFTDTLEGASNAIEAADTLIAHRIESAAMEAAMKDIAATYATRAARFKAQHDACTAGLGKLLDAIGTAKLTCQRGTVSRTKPRQRIDIHTPDDVPSQLCKRVPDAAAIKAQIEAGEFVPGADIVTGEPGLTVRTK